MKFLRHYADDQHVAFVETHERLGPISRAVANALQLKLGRGRRAYDPDAFDLYLRARAAASTGFPGNDDVIGLLEQAVGKDR